MSELKCLPQESVIWGKAIIAEAVTRLSGHGVNRPIVFTAEPLVPLYEKHIQPFLKDVAGLTTALPAHVPDFAVEAALDAAIAAGAKSIVALGGGSVLDAAKAVSHFHHQRTGEFLPIAAFPTTLSGSEFSHYFGVTETSGPQKFKRSYAVSETTPRVVVIDPVLVEGTPRALLLSSAIKGLDHAVEGMRKVESDHPHAILAASGAERFLSVLERWPSGLETVEGLRSGKVDHDDLLQLQLAAWQCYFYPASVIYGLSHRIGHILGGTYGVPHSMTSCITLAPVIRACADFYGRKLTVFSPESGTILAAEVLANRIENVVRRLELPNRIGAFNLSPEELPAVAALLESNYPNEVADLGENASDKLATLLGSIW
ncbi:iron-containing alcohol dehydrogenase [Ensifer adhaerens]|uniref:iron-containing alcohol dehydrogenase n=1 Tax=Ensifer adhaerens TaxID=106592 RepID=UPI001CBBFC35|nr:iron-containing alcohol dehydrogenase [Ensifer adhaerens]MBZ7924839.1 iron-containing alcohol dehydrogenase [Ensifer adhaerens]UAX95943.1 iron-containing alcohol dehydrogenase [Ensifer adhaerens]UAY04715.1 iron-containing alcohol dehydrogenase [Ensifer adhaerens]UAY10146.1 iron-containing alcohol dehydrogenase [Ensifer adhaerens]